MPALADISRSVEFCKVLREAVGDRADFFGTHGQFTTAAAIRLGKALEPYRPLWFEEPIPPISIGICTGREVDQDSSSYGRATLYQG